MIILSGSTTARSAFLKGICVPKGSFMMRKRRPAKIAFRTAKTAPMIRSVSSALRISTTWSESRNVK